jgi:hypothetical protein
MLDRTHYVAYAIRGLLPRWQYEKPRYPLPPDQRTPALQHYCDQLRAAALQQPYVEFVGSSVYHLVDPSNDHHTRCATGAGLPYPGRDGTVICTHVDGTPFPAFVAQPSPGRRPCRHCAGLPRRKRPPKERT